MLSKRVCGVLAVAAAVLTYSSALFAQSSSWRAEFDIAPVNTHYDETPGAAGPELTGNSFAVLPLRLEVSYSGRQDYRIPFWMDITGELPTAASSGQEVGTLMKSGTEYTVQQEHTSHRLSRLSASLGYEMLPFFQPYVAFELTQLASRRTGQQNGQDNGTLLPDPNQDYTETVSASYLGFGVMSVVPLDDDADRRIRVNVAVLNAQTASVTNDYFGNGTWGQHTTGYELKARIAFEMLSGVLPMDHSYLSVGLEAAYQSWNGDGNVGYGMFQTPYWPANSVTQVGAFAGLGLFF